MTVSVGKVEAWRSWGDPEWGQALLVHYFSGHDDRAVSRLVISPEELAKAAGAPPTETVAARKAFLRAVRSSPTAFRNHLSGDCLQGGEWNHPEPPPFLAHLFFTCFAAGSLEAETADEGVFRERVRHLLEHPAGTSYSFGGLSPTWEAFAAWLERRRDAGKSYRNLTLPDRGWMTLIGYSVRLAFPLRKDRLRLRDVLADLDAESTPTVHEAFQVVERARGFSQGFCRVLERARAALASGHDAPELQALWSAIREASALAARPQIRSLRVRYQLLAQEDDLYRLDPFVVVSHPIQIERGDIRLARLEEPFDAFDHVLSAGDDLAKIATMLLNGTLADKVPRLRESPIVRAVREGVLLFREVDRTWDLAVTKPGAGRVRALVRTRLSNAFLQLLGGSARPPRSTRFDGWREIETFDIAELVEAQTASGADLAAVRCLQRVDIGSRIHLVDGIGVEKGYLGFRELLPRVHCPEADDAVVFRVVDDQPPVPIATLQPIDGAHGAFGWPVGSGDLEGEHRFKATRKGREVAARTTLFRSRLLSHDYEGPTDPERWLVEAATSDVAPAGDPGDGFLATEIGITSAAKLDPRLVEGVSVFTGRSIDDEVLHDRLVEALAAISVARKGIAEGELIEIFGKLGGKDYGFPVWDTLRGWLEAGYLDCLARRHWRGRAYFARRPRLVLISDANDPSVRAVVHGLAPYYVRSVVRSAFARGGAMALPAASLSPYVPAPQAWRFESREHADAVIADLRDLSTVSVREPKQLVGDFAAAVSDLAPLPPGYERQRMWDWTTGAFRQWSGAGNNNSVRIEHHTRINGPDRYVVDAGDRRCTTRSRSWALLEGFRRAGKRAFTSAGSIGILRLGHDGPHVPLPIARAIGLRAGIVAGPTETPSLGRHYAYATESPREQSWLLAWLHGEKAEDVVVRRFAWLRAATSAHNVDAVRLPSDLRRRLRDLHSVPDALLLADRPIPRHLVAHVRNAMRLAET